MTSPLSYLIGQTLTWVPTATFRSLYDLIAPDNTIIAHLDMSNWSSKAVAAVPEGKLFLRKEGWTGSRIAIYAFEGGPLVATYQRNMWTGMSGELTLADGRRYKWGNVNFWGTQKAWKDPSNSFNYVQFSSGGFSRKVTAVIDPQSAEIPELSLLLVLGLYTILTQRRDAAASSASTGVVVTG